MNSAAPQEMFISALLRALPSDYARFKEQFEFLNVDEQTMGNLIQKLQTKMKDLEGKRETMALYAKGDGSANQMRRQQQRRVASGNHQAMCTGNQNGQTQSDVICNFCRNTGHMKDECRKLLRKKLRIGEITAAQFEQMMNATMNKKHHADEKNTADRPSMFRQTNKYDSVNNNSHAYLSSNTTVDNLGQLDNSLKHINFVATIEREAQEEKTCMISMRQADDNEISKWLIDSDHMSPRKD